MKTFLKIFLPAMILGGSSLMAQNTFPSSGNVGIGSSSPTAQLHIVQSQLSSTDRIKVTKINGASTYTHLIVKSDGNVGIGVANPSQMLDVGGKIASTGSTGGTFTASNPDNQNAWVKLHWLNNKPRINFGGSGSGSNNGFEIVGLNNETLLHFAADGDAGIGTTTIPNGFKLAVDGGIIAELVQVDLSQNWPDYVFEQEYSLQSIDELKAFVDEHKHLPNVPAADEVEQKGINLGEMQGVLLEKIEELSLYVIELNDRLKSLEAENQNLKSEKAKMEGRSDDK